MRRPSAAVILIISLLSFLIVCPILAGPIEDSRKALRGGDYKTAYQLIRPQAEKGDAVAQSNLGLTDNQGRVSKERTEKEKWHRGATE